MSAAKAVGIGGDVGKVFDAYTDFATLGVSSLIRQGDAAKQDLGQMQDAGTAPTMEEAKKNAQNSDMLRSRTYGRMGTIMNQGGMKGIASSLLNISTPTLMGKP